LEVIVVRMINKLLLVQLLSKITPDQ